MTKHDLWMEQAPAFNFELDEDAMIALAVKQGVVIETAGTEGEYEYNPEWLRLHSPAIWSRMQSCCFCQYT